MKIHGKFCQARPFYFTLVFEAPNQAFRRTQTTGKYAILMPKVTGGDSLDFMK